MQADSLQPAPDSATIVTARIWFADTELEARRQVAEWLDAEPRVTDWQIQSLTMTGRFNHHADVVLRLEFAQDAEQLELVG